ncbi:MAG: succinylglutamate desuccinylase [Oligoflexia bacterium]|nr:succinylglutamate desuccinylase [Oligoflexia bacterium]
MKLNILNEIPKELLSCSVEQLHSLLGGPTLIHLDYGKEQTISISTLLHGNEHSGFYAIQDILNQISLNKLSTQYNIALFIGNTEAAKENIRHIEGRPDFNRIWSHEDCEEAKIANEVIKYLEKLTLFCNVDIHNNTGKNPFYACINRIEDNFLALADFFFDNIVYFTEPHEVQSMALARLCPSVTLEAGRSNETKGIAELVTKISSLLNLKELHLKKNKKEINVYHTVARLRVDEDATINFKEIADKEVDLSFIKDLDELNFKIVKKDTFIGFINNHQKLWLESKPLENCFDDYFEIIENKIYTKKEMIPAMLTQNIEVMKSDCLGYVMEKYEIL